MMQKKRAVIFGMAFEILDGVFGIFDGIFDILDVFVGILDGGFYILDGIFGILDLVILTRLSLCRHRRRGLYFGNVLMYWIFWMFFCILDLVISPYQFELVSTCDTEEENSGWTIFAMYVKIWAMYLISLMFFVFWIWL